MMSKGYTNLQMEAALCVWEHWLSLRDCPKLTPMFENHGSVFMRHLSIEVGTWAEQVFERWCAQTLDNRDRLEGCPYDWEIIPAIVANLTFETRSGMTFYPPDSHVFSELEKLAEKLNPMPKPKRIRHLTTGREYTVLGLAEAQVSAGTIMGVGRVRTISDGNVLNVYQANDGKLWIRFPDELAGRFEEIPS